MKHLYYNISMQIIIADQVEFTVCKSFSIDRSVQNLTGTAKIELPREFRNALSGTGESISLDGRSILDFIRRGDSVVIRFGYDGDDEIEFEGYVKTIGADVPLVLECEDEMYQLKKASRISKTIKSGKLADILKAVIPSKYTIQCDADYQIGTWVIKDATPYEVLDDLRKQAGIRAFFKSPTVLKVGMVVDFKPNQIHEFNFSRNVRRGSNLKFENKEDHPKEIIVSSKQPNGKELSYTVGEKGGDSTKVSLFPGLTQQQLKTWGDKLYASQSFTGFRGSLDSWCYPRTMPGDTVVVSRPFYEDGHQDGRYFVESVIITFNESNGIKRSNKLTYKLS